MTKMTPEQAALLLDYAYNERDGMAEINVGYNGGRFSLITNAISVPDVQAFMEGVSHSYKPPSEGPGNIQGNLKFNVKEACIRAERDYGPPGTNVETKRPDGPNRQ
jgi:hypothetical protein